MIGGLSTVYTVHNYRYEKCTTIPIENGKKYIIVDEESCTVHDVLYGYMLVGHVEKDNLVGSKWSYSNVVKGSNPLYFHNVSYAGDLGEYVIIEPKSPFKVESTFDKFPIYIKKLNMHDKIKFYLIIADWCFELKLAQHGIGILDTNILDEPAATHLFMNGYLFGWYQSAKAVDRRAEMLIELSNIRYHEDSNTITFALSSIVTVFKSRLFTLTKERFSLDMNIGVLESIGKLEGTKQQGIHINNVVRNLVFGD